MNADNVVVMAICLAVLLVFLVVFVEHMAPMFMKARFDEVCRNYLLIAEANNGLDSAQRTRLKDELSSLGLKNISINVSEKDSVARRRIMQLEVECLYEYGSLVDLFKREDRNLSFVFDRRFLARRIVQ